MKLKNIFKYAAIAVASGSMLTGITSCNYLDVVPPEQAGLSDAMKTPKNAIGFLYSCYAGLNASPNFDSRNYFGGCYFSNSTGEYVLPESWRDSEIVAFAVQRNVLAPGSATHTSGKEWDKLYRYIGQCWLFESELEKYWKVNELCSQTEHDEWLAETKFLKAYYSFMLIRQYGPVPMLDRWYNMDLSNNDFPGRHHFDYCVDKIIKWIDEAYLLLPDEQEETRHEGRATKVIAKALKARVLLYAASDLWNGSFPGAYKSTWRNKNFETPGYGKELVAQEFDPNKWVRAYEASREALQYCLDHNYKLWDNPTIKQDEKTVKPADIYVPFPTGYDANDSTSVQKLADFKNHVATMRYAFTTNQSLGNQEIIWSVRSVGGTYIKECRLPKNVLTKENEEGLELSFTGGDQGGFNGVSPTLRSVEVFYTKDGTLPEYPLTAFPDKNTWYQKAGLTDEGREEVMNICCNREPRFYAWIAFHNGDYLTRLCNGRPKRLDFAHQLQQGRQRGNDRNYATCGFLTMKHVSPSVMFSATTTGKSESGSGWVDSPSILIRLGELYLNLAECAAEMQERGITLPADSKYAADNGNFEQIAYDMINTIRARAGVPALTPAIVAQTKAAVESDDNPEKPYASFELLDWVKRERAIEMWNEGQLYFDARRWVEGKKYFGAGTLRGLNGEAYNDSFESFAQVKNADVQATWHDRLYLFPLYIDEVYSNPQMVQAPGY